MSSPDPIKRAEKVGDVLHDLPFSDVLQLAEALGWREPELSGAWDATMADALEAEAIDFILRAVLRGETSDD